MSTTRQLGLLPADPARPVLRLARYLTGKVPEHPPAVDYLSKVNGWGLYANDVFGVCGPAAVANQRRQVSRYLTGTQADPTIEDVFALYRASGNPEFDPATGVGDSGVVLADMLSALLRTGIAGVRPLAYAAVDVTEPDEVRAAIGLFGSLILGVDLDEAQEAQTDAGQPWDYVRRSGEWGGHAVLAGAYTGASTQGEVDISVISWGERIGMTDDFAARQLSEAWVVIWPELLGTEEFADGVDLSTLARDYEALTGRPFPSLGSSPTPAPADPAAEFKTALATFVAAAQTYLEAT